MKNPIIIILDYGVGNTHSVFNAITYLGYKKVRISDDKKIIERADALILPGVGAFEACANNLRHRGLVEILNEEVQLKKKPILGICVGMQLLATKSHENGVHKGLNWIEGEIKKLVPPESYAVPHVGWNDVSLHNKNDLFMKGSDARNFYFDHSYHFECDEKYITSSCDYGIRVTASVQKENIFGVQFHPEKSQTAGLKLFRSFFNSL